MKYTKPIVSTARLNSLRTNCQDFSCEIFNCKSFQCYNPFGCTKKYNV